MQKPDELLLRNKPVILSWIKDQVSAIGGSHVLSGSMHSGQLADSQAPQFLKSDGTRLLIGNLSVGEGITIDGVDLSIFKAAYDSHLNSDSHPMYATDTITLTAGTGLTGGGDLSANRTFNVVGGLGIIANADDVAVKLKASAGLGVDTAGVFIDKTQNFEWTGLHTFSNSLSAQNIYPKLTDTYDLGSSTLLWRKIWVSELDAVVFAKNTKTLIGGWWSVTKGEGVLPANVLAEATEVDFGQAMTVGDFVEFRNGTPAVEYMQVVSLVSGTTYNVTRDLDGSGADAWVAGSVFAINGQSGDGRIEFNAYDTPRSSMIMQGTGYNAQTELIRWGDLNGNWGFTVPTWGIGIGEFATGKPNLIATASSIKLRNHTTDIIRLDTTGQFIDGVLQFGSAGGIFHGTGTFAAPNTGLKIYSSTSIGMWESWGGGVKQTYIGADGKFYAGGGNVRLDADGIFINGASSLGFYIYGTAPVGKADMIQFANYNNVPVMQKGTGIRQELDGINIVTKISSSTAQAIASGSWVKVALNTLDFERKSSWHGSFAVLIYNAIYIPESGYYEITGNVIFDVNATGDRGVLFKTNNSVILGTTMVRASAGVHTGVTHVARVWLNQSDAVYMYAYQSSGANLNIVALNGTPTMSVALIAR